MTFKVQKSWTYYYQISKQIMKIIIFLFSYADTILTKKNPFSVYFRSSNLFLYLKM